MTTKRKDLRDAERHGVVGTRRRRHGTKRRVGDGVILPLPRGALLIHRAREPFMVTGARGLRSQKSQAWLRLAKRWRHPVRRHHVSLNDTVRGVKVTHPVVAPGVIFHGLRFHGLCPCLDDLPVTLETTRRMKERLTAYGSSWPLTWYWPLTMEGAACRVAFCELMARESQVVP